MINVFNKIIHLFVFIKNTQNRKIYYFGGLIHKKIIKINSKVNLKSKNSKKKMILTINTLMLF